VRSGKTLIQSTRTTFDEMAVSNAEFFNNGSGDFFSRLVHPQYRPPGDSFQD
jgi:hypothetical protein